MKSSRQSVFVTLMEKRFSPCWIGRSMLWGKLVFSMVSVGSLLLFTNSSPLLPPRDRTVLTALLKLALATWFTLTNEMWAEVTCITSRRNIYKPVYSSYNSLPSVGWALKCVGRWTLYQPSCLSEHGRQSSWPTSFGNCGMSGREAFVMIGHWNSEV